MYIKPVLSLAGMPSIGQLTNPAVPQQVMDQINSKYLNSGVIFGGVGDAMATAYNNFNQAFTQTAIKTSEILDNVRELVKQKERMTYLYKEESFEHVPTCMYLPMLTHAPIREWHDNKVIDGWGISPMDIPEYDPYINVLSNGYHEINVGDTAEYDTWTWATDDPEVSDAEVDIIRESRRFLEAFIYAELDEGSLRDPTGWTDGLYLND